MEKAAGLIEVFKIFQNAESYFEERNKEQSRKLILNQLLIICVFTFLFGMRLMVDALKFACEKKDIYPLLNHKVLSRILKLNQIGKNRVK